MTTDGPPPQNPSVFLPTSASFIKPSLGLSRDQGLWDEKGWGKGQEVILVVKLGATVLGSAGTRAEIRQEIPCKVSTSVL